MAGQEGRERNKGLQVIHAGLFRTGTKSMAEAYEILGYKTHHGLDSPSDNPWLGVERAAEATWPGVDGARPRPAFTRDDWDALWAGWDITTDIASPFNIQLIKAYPEAKVVVVQRDFEAWRSSFQSQVLNPLFPIGGSIMFFISRHLVKYYAPDAMRKTLLGFFRATNKREIEENLQETYEEYYREIRALVPPERRLEYKLGSGWEPLCTFLGKKVPDVPFPWANDREAHAEELRAQWKALFISWAKAALWCGGGIGAALSIWRYLR
ncbi:hypothetical protein GGR51DRAFT_534906 [Nemania sp. FL0031]|nr:hypothetical protein GGR51DRAFT_534906 [Nemania sp. FL0031]